MKTKIPIFQFALVAVAMVVGILADRLLFAKEPTPPREVARTVAASGETSAAAPAAPSTKNSANAVEEKQTSPANQGASRKALDAILATKDPRQRSRDLQAYINALNPGEFPEALKRIRQMTGSNERELASRLLAANWVQTDPDGALQFAAGNRNFQYLADDVFQQRALNNFDSALAQAREIPGNDLRYRAMRGVLAAKTDSDPAAAIQLAQTMGEFRGTEPLTNVVYRQWAATDPQAAALYASQQGSGGGWRSPITQVVNTWAEQDPVAAANWTLSLADAETQQRSISQVTRDWGRRDPTAAANWIHSLPTGTQRDTAVAGLAQSMVFADPQTALGWIGTMTDETSKQRTLQQVSREVMARDPENGQALLLAAGLPANQIAQPQRRGRGGSDGQGRGPGGGRP